MEYRLTEEGRFKVSDKGDVIRIREGQEEHASYLLHVQKQEICDNNLLCQRNTNALLRPPLSGGSIFAKPKQLPANKP